MYQKLKIFLNLISLEYHSSHGLGIPFYSLLHDDVSVQQFETKTLKPNDVSQYNCV